MAEEVKINGVKYDSGRGGQKADGIVELLGMTDPAYPHGIEFVSSVGEKVAYSLEIGDIDAFDAEPLQILHVHAVVVHVLRDEGNPVSHEEEHFQQVPHAEGSGILVRCREPGVYDQKMGQVFNGGELERGRTVLGMALERRSPTGKELVPVQCLKALDAPGLIPPATGAFDVNNLGKGLVEDLLSGFANLEGEVGVL
ncbi:MAG: hypothetical protein ACWGSD_20570, partial [Thermodesulfobacteriota bacterium]